MIISFYLKILQLHSNIQLITLARLSCAGSWAEKEWFCPVYSTPTLVKVKNILTCLQKLLSSVFGHTGNHGRKLKINTLTYKKSAPFLHF